MLTAKFATTQEIDHKPTFNWWVKLVHKKRDREASSVRKQQTRYLKKSQKIGRELSKTLKQALILGTKNGNISWEDSISKELENIIVVIKILLNGAKAPIDHQFVQFNMVVDIKMEDFRHKARVVAGGHMTEAPATIEYASVVWTETIKVALMITTLNEDEVKSGGILNAYVQAPVIEMV